MGLHPNRRQFLLMGGLAVAGAAATGTPAVAEVPSRTTTAGSSPAWNQADRIVRLISRPRIPDRTVSVTEFGAVGDGLTDCTQAFKEAFAKLADESGGRLVVPAGRFLTGPIHLESRIELHVEKGATILFSTDPAAYLPVVYTRDGGIECMNYSPFIYAYGKHDIAITGQGVLDGQASNQHWWPWAGKTQFGWQPGMPTGSDDAQALEEMADQGVPVEQRVMGAGHYLRPSFIEPYNCQRVLISGITMHNTPNWQLHPVLSSDVIVENVTASSHGPNNDGCDPESCQTVLIQGCTFDTGDDCIAVKAGKNADGRRVNVPSEDIVIQDCEFLMGHGAITIGSEMTGGVRNVYARNCRVDSSELNEGIRLKTNSMRGGFIENLHVKNVTMQQVSDAMLLVDFSYGEGAGHGFNPVVQGITLEDTTVGTATYPVYAVGYDDDHIADITLRNVRVDHAAEASVLSNCDDVIFENVIVNGEPVSANP